MECGNSSPLSAGPLGQFAVAGIAAGSIAAELGLPIRYLGVGEGEGDLEDFSPREFVEALLS